jgi:hypothetical protein
MNDVIAPLIPKEIHLFLGFVQVRNIYAKDFTVDTTRAKFTIDEMQRGIMMNWAKITNWHIHFELWYILFWPIEYSFKVDILAKNVLIDNGLSLQADKHSGAPIVNLFNTYVDLADSSIAFSGDFVVYILGWLANFFKTPLNILINEFFQPFMNFLLNDFIIADFFSNGFFKIATTYNNKFYDNLIIDLTLPEEPVFSPGKVDVFTDAAIYFQNQGEHYQSPTTPMRFQLDEQNFQFVISSFTVNSLIDTVLETGLINIPVNHDLVYQLSGFELTTTLMFAIVPELLYNYGARNMTLGIKPLTGTTVNWNATSKSTNVQAQVLIQWIIDEDSFDNVTATAFESVLDLDVDLTFSVNATKYLKINVDELMITKFNVTQDNLGGQIKSDEGGIEYRLNTILGTIEIFMNDLFNSLNLRLPELNLIDYSVKFDVQDGALGTGLLITKK